MKNKTILLLALLFCVFVQVNAQVSIVPKAGANMAQFVGPDNDVDPQRLLLPQAGLMVNIGLSETLALQPGLIYSVKGEKMKSQGGESTGKYYFQYLEIPLNIGYSFNLLAHNFHIFAGPYFGYCFEAKMETEYGTHASFPIGDSDDDVYKPSDFGYTAGIGYRLKKIQIQAEYQGSFATISNYGELRNSVISLTLGYFINLKKKEK